MSENKLTDEGAEQNVLSEKQTGATQQENLNTSGGANHSNLVKPGSQPLATCYSPILPAHQIIRVRLFEKKSSDLAAKGTEKNQFVNSKSTPLSEKVNPLLYAPLNGIDMFSSKDEIHVSSFFGTDFIRSGISTDSKIPVSHFSQIMVMPFLILKKGLVWK